MRLIVLAMLAPSLLLASFAAHAQPAGKVYHVGHVTSVDFDQPEQIELRHWSAFVQALRTLGWIEGKNFVFERRLVSSRGSLQQAAEDFVRTKVDVIVVAGGARAAAIQQVTRTVPIVTLSAPRATSSMPSASRDAISARAMVVNPSLEGEAP